MIFRISQLWQLLIFYFYGWFVTKKNCYSYSYSYSRCPGWSLPLHHPPQGSGADEARRCILVPENHFVVQFLNVDDQCCRWKQRNAAVYQHFTRWRFRISSVSCVCSSDHWLQTALLFSLRRAGLQGRMSLGRSRRCGPVSDHHGHHNNSRHFGERFGYGCYGDMCASS